MATTTTSMANESMNKANSSAAEFKNKAAASEASLERLSHNAGERIGAMATNIADSTRHYVEEGREYVKENPAKSIAIAAAAGAVVGSLVTLAMRRRD